ncbi:MAG: magnesium transporter [Ignavibacteriales bacterium]|nr:magnesium transporter [Ignavibacteriales bacterium]MCF8314632.1 magnesium transporter [Ignavibacteriales bacterium]MCF8436331.1 magnesium transporter [Ignavibacteriales bacterium]
MTENNNLTIKELIKVDKELLENVSILIENQDSQSILNLLADLHPADVAEILNHLNLEDATFIFNLLDNETASEVVVHLDDNFRSDILGELNSEKISDIVDELDSDDAVDIMGDLPEEVAEEVLSKIDKEDSEEFKELMKYPEDSAGGIMSSDFVYVHKDSTIKDAIREVRKNAEEFEHIYQVYVIDDAGRLLGFVQLKLLLIKPLKTKVNTIMSEDLIFVSPTADQEEVARIMEKYDLVSLPVVDENRIMLGRITIDDIVDVINEEATEDIQKIAGLSEEQEPNYSVFRISRIRLPWLAMALVLEFFNAILLSSYENIIEQFYIATFFIPIVMAMGGSSGTQAAIVMVRSLSSGEIWFKHSLSRLIKEFGVALLNGLACSVVLLLGVTVFFPGNKVTFEFGIFLSAALLTVMVTATMLGATIPLIFKKFKTDPAIATGPFVTTANDILGLIIYFSLITIYLAGR